MVFLRTRDVDQLTRYRLILNRSYKSVKLIVEMGHRIWSIDIVCLSL